MSTSRHLSRFFLPLVLAAVLAAAVLAKLAFAKSAATVGNGIVIVYNRLAYSGEAAAGTGMVLTSSGEILTNNHVVSGAGKITVTVPATGSPTREGRRLRRRRRRRRAQALRARRT